MNGRHVSLAAIAMLICGAAAGAQIVPVKSSPLAEGDQFTFLPSATRSMAGVTITVPDTLLDPFLNPAAGMRLRKTSVFGAPSFYSLSKNGSTGTTLPLGLTSQRGPYFSAVAFATQVVEPTGRANEDCCVAVPLAGAPVSSSVALIPSPGQQHSRTNNYLFAGAGRTLRDSTTAIAASLQWSRMGGVDGADLLYPGAENVGQRVDNIDIRIGAVKDWATRSLEAVLVHQRWSARHDVTYLGFIWDPGTRAVLANPHTDVNFDRRHTFGVHVNAQQRLADTAWRVGALLTANRTTQPTMPAFGSMVPSGDPGRSAAFNMGVGLSRTSHAATAGVDAIFEPIWAQRRLAAGGEDRYRFANAILRGGVMRDFALGGPAGTFCVQGGALWHRISYSLDELAGSTSQHRSRAAWSEWTHTLGAAFRSTRYELRYEWRMLSGVTRPGTTSPGGFVLAERVAADVFAPVFPELRMLPVHVTTQQFSFSVRMP